MNKDKYVFSVLSDFLDRSKFSRIVAKCNGDRYIKSFSCWNHLLSDAVGHFTVYKSAKVYPEEIRKIVYCDPETGKEYIFLTNDFESDALTIALLYKYRWSIELFFKWLKQHLKIKRFWGTSENAVRIQTYCAIITYCLVAIVQHDMELERSIYEVLQIFSISLTDKTPLKDLFDKQNFNNVNELNGSSEPSLFQNLIY